MRTLAEAIESDRENEKKKSGGSGKMEKMEKKGYEESVGE